MFLLGLALFGDVISYIRCKDSARAHIFALHCASGVQTDLSSNSIQQHGVPAWPAGRPREYQHGLLVVQGSISMASTHAPSCSHPPHFFTLFNLQPNNVSRRGATVQSHLTSLPEVYEPQEVFAAPDPFPLICALDGIQR